MQFRLVGTRPVTATTMTNSNCTQACDLDQLNSFLRGEISAVETYEQAIDKTDDGTALGVLRDNQHSHADRVSLLRSEVAAHGGEPADGSGVWGAFAKAIEGTSSLFGDSAAIAALEEGEDHGLADYRRDYADLSQDGREFVRTKLLPEQEKTHDRLATLKKIL